MIDDITFDVTDFILEIPYGAAGGTIDSYSMDGASYDLHQLLVVRRVQYLLIN